MRISDITRDPLARHLVVQTYRDSPMMLFMKQKKSKSRVSPVPAPPAWAKREILTLARDSGMMTNRLYDMVIRNGLEATRSLLEEQIRLIASIDNGPIEELSDQSDRPTVAAESPSEPVAMVNGTEQPENNGTPEGSNHVSERRTEPGESKPDDFLTRLVSGQSGGVTNAEV